MSNPRLDRIRRNPLFDQLCASRSRFAWTLSLIMVVIYMGFILLVAFAGDFMATPLASDSVMTIGLPIGVAVMLSAVVLTAIYVWKANTSFDELNRRLLEESK